MLVRHTPAASRRAAFTLMEVLVVVAILVVLAGVGGVIFMKAQEDGYTGVARTKANSLGTACERYALNNNGQFPGSLHDLLVSDGGSQPYVEADMIKDPWGREFQYAFPGPHHPNGNKPDIWSTGSRGDKMIGNWTEGN